MGESCPRPCPTASVVSTFFSHALCSRESRVLRYGFQLRLPPHKAGGSHSKLPLLSRSASPPAGSLPSSMPALRRFRKPRRSEAELASSIVWFLSRKFASKSIPRKELTRLLRSMAGGPVAGKLPGSSSHPYIGMILFTGTTTIAGSFFILWTRFRVESRLLARA